MKAIRTLFPTVSQAKSASSKMSEGRQMKGQTLQQPPTKLALAELKSVQWAQEQRPVMYLQKGATDRYTSLKETQLIGWVVVLTEMWVVWWWTFLHNLPWPPVVLNGITTVDSFTFRTLDYTQQRLEWWWDVASVRLMWLRESIENFLDRSLTTADTYFAMVQDWVLGVYKFAIKTARNIYDTFNSYTSQMPGQTTTANILNKNGSLRRNSEGYEPEDNEEWGEEDYPSDTSSNTRRLIKEDSTGESYMRHRTTTMAEGKFRQAMYRRVQSELSVMRKNSIRFSRGIVNYARQMVEIRTRKYGGSFLEFCRGWVQELGLPELLVTIQQEMKDRPFLAKPLALVQVLSEAWLAFLLRLVKGKRSRRTRSMRSESLRRRTLSQSGTSNPLPLSPAALQQSSEPVQHPLLPVPATLRVVALKEEEEDLDGFLSKDSALGSEYNHSESAESDHTISPNDEGLESDSDVERHEKNTFDVSEGAQATSIIDKEEEVEERQPTQSNDSNNSPIPTTARRPGIMSSPEPPSQKSHLKKPKSNKQKRVTISN